MKVLHVVGSLDKTAGGPSRSVPQTCEQLSLLGVSIDLIARQSSDPVELDKVGFNVRFMNIKQLIKFGYSLSAKDYDLIHLQHVWDPYIHVMAYFARVKGIPYIITPRGMLEPWIMNRHPWKKKIAMMLYQRKDIAKATYLHATCEMEKENISQLGFSNSIYMIPNGLDLSKIKDLKTDYSTKKIVFLSRIHPKKGIELLLDAWKQIKTDWTVEIAGDGDENYINTINEKIKIDKIKNVTLVGSKYGDDKWSFLKSGDICILPTYSENFGIVVAEALATGIPVITTTGTPWQELETNNCGWWIDLNIENLTNTITKALLLKPEELKEMGVKGRKLVEEKYEIKAVAIEMEKLYKNLLRKNIDMP
jgi:glycosyltransferase involved in cell wall biosynthesis